MARWTEWHPLPDAGLRGGPLNRFGIYEIRLVRSLGSPIPIPRFCARDSTGVIYIGRSGLKRQQTGRTISHRLAEFLRGPHRAGRKYKRFEAALRQLMMFRQHRLEVRGLFLPDDQIGLREAKRLCSYRDKFGELPPFNSSLPTTKANRSKRRAAI